MIEAHHKNIRTTKIYAHADAHHELIACHALDKSVSSVAKVRNNEVGTRFHVITTAIFSYVTHFEVSRTKYFVYLRKSTFHARTTAIYHVMT